MKIFVSCAAIALLALTGAAAEAKGCLKGAAVGGVAGHVAGHHGFVGAAAGCVIAVEIDRDLATMLRERFASEEKLVLTEGDALAGKHQLNEQLLQYIRGVGVPPTRFFLVSLRSSARARRPRHGRLLQLLMNVMPLAHPHERQEILLAPPAQFAAGALGRGAGVILEGEGRWLAVPALFFAIALAWRDSPTLNVGNWVALVIALGLAVLIAAWM